MKTGAGPGQHQADVGPGVSSKMMVTQLESRETGSGVLHLHRGSVCVCVCTIWAESSDGWCVVGTSCLAPQPQQHTHQTPAGK